MKLSGSAPSPRTLAILWAQWAHETARGTRMYGHNFGGIKGTGPTGMSLRLRTREGHGAGERTLRDTFRAYPDARSGAQDWLELLRDRYPAAMASAQQGDADGFVRGLRARGYFTGSADEYQRAIGALVREAIEGPGVAQSSQPIRLGMWEQGVVEAFRRASERRHDSDEQGG